METRSLTYDELGRALGITPASAKRLAIRRKWDKQPGNDGRTRVSVPVERLAEASEAVASDAADDVPGDAADDVPGDVTGGVLGVVGILERHVERLERDLGITQATLDALRFERAADQDRIVLLTAQAATVEPLKDTIEALREASRRERERADELRAERDGLMEQVRSSVFRDGLLTRLRRALR